ncbi:unnamed protein product [Cladocopium goreaui]|uniref:ZZ-type domain-containing protein n=1 Tax=Cladocopium goreaui TaxID=2562237 RepID=A0A9P1BW09_9DINO|nr:unnamed protein product [Cladocopium goreaui]
MARGPSILSLLLLGVFCKSVLDFTLFAGRSVKGRTALSAAKKEGLEYLFVGKDTKTGKLGRVICELSRDKLPVRLQAVGNLSIQTAVRSVIRAEGFLNNETSDGYQEPTALWVHSAWHVVTENANTNVKDRFSNGTTLLEMVVEPKPIVDEETEVVLKVGRSTERAKLASAISVNLQQHKKIQLSFVPDTVPMVMKTLPRAEKILEYAENDPERSKILFRPAFKVVTPDEATGLSEFTMMRLELIPPSLLVGPGPLDSPERRGSLDERRKSLVTGKFWCAHMRVAWEIGSNGKRLKSPLLRVVVQELMTTKAAPTGGWLQPPQGLPLPQPILMPTLNAFDAPATLEQQADLANKAKQIEVLQQHVAYLQQKVMAERAPIPPAPETLARLMEEAQKAPSLPALRENFRVAEESGSDIYRWFMREGTKIKNCEENSRPLFHLIQTLGTYQNKVKSLETRWQQLEALLASDAKADRSRWPASPSQWSASPMPSSPQKQDLCPAGHAVQHVTTAKDGIICQVCNAIHARGSMMVRCEHCNFDACNRCLKEAPPLAPLAPERVIQADVRQPSTIPEDSVDAGSPGSPAATPKSPRGASPTPVGPQYTSFHIKE